LASRSHVLVVRYTIHYTSHNTLSPLAGILLGGNDGLFAGVPDSLGLWEAWIT